MATNKTVNQTTGTPVLVRGVPYLPIGVNLNGQPAWHNDVYTIWCDANGVWNFCLNADGPGTGVVVGSGGIANYLPIANGQTGPNGSYSGGVGSFAAISATVSTAPATSVGTGTWSTGATWDSGVAPSAGDAVVIDTAVTVGATLDTSVFASITINAGKTLTSNVAQTVAGTILGTGTWSFFQNVTIAAGAVINAGLTFKLDDATASRTFMPATGVRLPKIVIGKTTHYPSPWVMGGIIECSGWRGNYYSQYTSNYAINVYGDIAQDTMYDSTCTLLTQMTSGSLTMNPSGSVKVSVAVNSGDVCTIAAKTDFGDAGNVTANQAYVKAITIGHGSVVTSPAITDAHYGWIIIIPSAGDTHFWTQQSDSSINCNCVQILLETQDATLANSMNIACPGYKDNYGQYYGLLVMSSGSSRKLTIASGSSVTVPSLAIYSSSSYTTIVDVAGSLVVSARTKIGSAAASGEELAYGQLYTSGAGTIRLAGSLCWGSTPYNGGGIFTMPPGVAVTSLAFGLDGSDYTHHKATMTGGSVFGLLD